MLADGLGRTECAGQMFPRRRVRRFERVQRLIDRAEAARRAARTRRLLERTARSLGKVSRGARRDGERGKVSGECVTALEAMLADGRRRAEELALGF